MVLAGFLYIRYNPGVMAPVHFRPMRKEDLPVLMRISRRNMADIILSSWGVNWRDENLNEMLMDPEAQTVVLENGERVVGYYCVERRGCCLFVNSIQVIPERRKEGLGRKMMVRIEERARKEGMEAVELWVQRTNSNALLFYRHLGYRTVAQRGNNFMMRKRMGGA
ncbi:MAG: N-acetyltransferase family protein [Methanomassiliicoccales archaeon]